MNLYFLVFFILSPLTYAAESTVRTFIAQYDVPVKRSVLKPYSTFSLKNYNLELHPNLPAQLSFQLPVEMTGVEQDIILSLDSEEGSKKFLSGPKGTAQCDGKWPELKCDIQFSDLDSSPAHLKSLFSKYSWNESRRRMKVSQSFINDPIGTVLVLKEIK